MASNTKIGSGQELENLLKGFMTQGALNPGSGFDRTWGVGQTEGEVLGRLNDWKRSRGIEDPSAAKPAAPSPVPAAVPPVSAPLAGLTAISAGTSTQGGAPSMGSTVSGSGMLEPSDSAMSVATDALGQLRNLGRRTLPVEGYALASLKKIY